MGEPNHPPLSGQLVGHLFRLLNVRYPKRLEKETQRYFAGITIDGANQELILYRLAHTLLEDGILPYPPVFEKAFRCRWAVVKMMVRGIRQHAEQWDSTCASLRSFSMQPSVEDLTTRCLRLAVVDMAIRVASIRHLSKLPPMDDSMPHLWAEEHGNKEFLRHLKERCNGTVSWPDLADSIGIRNDKTITNWSRPGKRPSRENRQKMAKELASRMPDTDESDLLAEINRHYGFAAVCERLAKLIGWEKVEELVVALFSQANRLQHLFSQDPKPVEDNYGRYVFWAFDTWVNTEDLRKHLWGTEGDPEWKLDFVWAGRDWVSRLVQADLAFTGETILRRRDEKRLCFESPRVTDQPSAVIEYVSPTLIDYSMDSRIAHWTGAGPEVHLWDEELERHLRRAVQSDPGSARDHLNLGVYLGQEALPPQNEEGLYECKRAAELEPGWDMPRVEAATILIRAGKFDDASNILEIAGREIPMTSRLAYATAFAKMMAGSFQDATVLFERALELNPGHGHAYDNAAYCSFHARDNAKGRKYAKRARQLGVSTAYDLFDVAGDGDNKDEKLRFCHSVRCKEENCPLGMHIADDKWYREDRDV